MSSVLVGHLVQFLGVNELIERYRNLQFLIFQIIQLLFPPRYLRCPMYSWEFWMFNLGVFHSTILFWNIWLVLKKSNRGIDLKYMFQYVIKFLFYSWRERLQFDAHYHSDNFADEGWMRFCIITQLNDFLVFIGNCLFIKPHNI